MCSRSCGIKTTIHFFLHCTNSNTQRQNLSEKTATIDATILTENEDSIVNTLVFEKLYSENSFDKAMPNVSIKLILSTGRFNNSLFKCYLKIIL